ncbi:hypothetical protein [Acinetobacter sp.]|uniref:hypothetical protein n=1 Tax=Acinetobacter sp. TaxID=472 RepID=UPI0024896736|nr:hypothetical protein [Acinetobacter sp.]MDI1223017.1 hypothetical protein [Acinetobacter sp.]
MAEPATSSTASFGLATNLAGGSMVLYAGLSTTEWMAVVGGICAVVGLIIQLWSAYRKDQRDLQLHNKRMHEKDYEQD